VTERPSEHGRGVGRRSSRAASSWLAWTLCGLTLALVACAYAFVILTTLRGRPTDVYSYLAPLGVIPYALVGGVVASRRHKNPVGWFLVSSAVIVALQDFMIQYTTYNPVTDSDVLPLRQELVWLLSWTYIPGFMLFLAFLPLYFPNGRLLSSRWRWVVRIAVLVTVACAVNSAFLPGQIKDLGIVNPLGVEALRPISSRINNLLFVTLFAVVFASAISLVLRFRRSRGQERQQIKWLAFAASLVPVWLVINYPVQAFSPLLFAVVENLMFMGIPVAVGIAVLRYRLYDIDRIINRTLVYGSLTAILVVVYFGGIVVLQRVFVLLTGQQSTLAVVASTLLIAALFTPLRRRIQGFIDRRFYRRKYDARKTLEAFSTKLKNETNLEALNNDLVGVVRETMQPAHVSLWLRPDPAQRRVGAD
jgi:hypothetical protein